jgi:branched-chain amino acid aminotransferase
MTIRVERVMRPRVLEADLTSVPFGTLFSDHMLIAEFEDGRWGQPLLRPYAPLRLAPSISALQYGVSVFEGLKAHRSPAGNVLLFRPVENVRRLQRSAVRLVMPPVPESLFLDGLRELVRLDQAWVPPVGAGALYIRPVLFSVDTSLRVKPAESYLFTIFTCPFADYFAAPIDVLVTDRYFRAVPGGTGDTKPAGNYAPALLAEKEARDSGFNSVMWLDSKERRYVEELGVMNVFFVLEDRIVTPDLSGTILPGITRDSVITLLRDMGHRIEERRFSVEEMLRSHERGELRECFGTGTAATVSHVRRIRYKERDLELAPVEDRAVGPRVQERLVAIRTGRAPDLHGWIERI